jgi:hypothetical protein
MSMAVGRRVGVGVALGLLGAVLLLAVVPGDPGAIRLAGVAAFWWFSLAAALISTLTSCICLRPPSNVPSTGSFADTPSTRSDTTAALVAASAAPVVLLVLASRVFAGAADAPVVVVAVLVAALVAALAGGPEEGAGTNRVASLATLVAAGLVLWATLLAVGDVAGVLGLPRWLAAALAAGLALLAGAWSAGDPGRALRWSLGAGALGFVIPVVAVGGVAAVSPWGAWSETASRPALTFAARSAWVTEGRRFAEATNLAFTEAHRVTALVPGVYRVIEESDRRRVTREWRLAAGDALTLRPGDHLALGAGARLRFEAGRRVPGAPVSGVAWADPPDRRRPLTLANTLGAALTLVAGALGLSPGIPAGARPTSRRISAGPAFLLLLVLAAVCWGVYGVHAAPELALGGRASAGLVELPALLLPTPAGRVLVATGVAALIFLFVATACALRGVATARGAPGPPLALWAGLLVVAAAASLWPGDAWRVFLAGCGLAGAAAAAPRLAGGGRAGQTAGSLVGAVAFAGLATAPGLLPAWAPAAATHPILLAGPLAWAAARVWTVAAAARG